jgi:hypothetical protein
MLGPVPADTESDLTSLDERWQFDLHEPLSEEITIKIQPSLLLALKARCEGRHGGKHDLPKHVRRILAEWVAGKADCYDCVFTKLSQKSELDS